MKTILPKWQIERANRLHRICSSITTRTARGQNKRKLVQWFAWYWKCRSYKCDPSRPLHFSVGVINRALRTWEHGGQVPSALLLKYTPRRSVFTSPMLVRFVNFIANCPQPSMKEAWRKFARRGGNFGPGRRAGKPLKITYGQLQYSFPAANFYLLRAQQRAMETAQANADALQRKFIAEICEWFPDRPPRRRIKRETDFSI
jgi:hypothetical protein